MGLLTGQSVVKYSQYTSDILAGNGATTTFTLSKNPPTASSIIVTIDGVKQHSNTYNVNGNYQIIFTEAPPANSSIEVVFIANQGVAFTPSDSSVGTTTIVNGAVNSSKYDVANANGTGAMQIPSGTSAQRPSSNISGHFRHNTDRKAVEFNDGTGWQVVKSLINTTGGVVVETPSYRLHAFLGSGTFYTDATITADILVVGGGGSGGQSYGDQDTGKGGGGAGGVVYKQGHSITSGSYTIMVGAGAGGMPRGFNGNNGTGINGDYSSAFGVTANGGGGGGCSDNQGAPAAGGCGGGGGSRNSTDSNNNGASSNQGSYGGWTSLGNAGGRSGGNGNFGGGGGGGAGGVGGTGQSTQNNSIGGTGGSGINLISIFGTWFGEGGWFAGGGAGGSYSTSGLLAQGVGGQGGGGNGTSAKEYTTGAAWNVYKINGQPNTGGGGGGSSEDQGLMTWHGAASGGGGSGIVLVKVYL
jgi:hypothetical protein